MTEYTGNQLYLQFFISLKISAANSGKMLRFDKARWWVQECFYILISITEIFHILQVNL